ncbi:MAG: ATP synthase F0 subunit B [Proteobacteria bacterium]|nr:ATP synthase F0 subunit B [Pseudomonadota bacterium]
MTVRMKAVLWGAIILAALLFPEFLLASGGESAEGHGGNQLADLGWRVLNFVVFAGIIYVAAAKPVRNFLNGRIEGIRKDLEDAEQAKEEAERKTRECLKKIENLEDEFREIEGTFIREGEVERDRMIEAAEAAAEKIRIQAQFSTEQELKKAIAAIKEQTAEAALALAEEVLKGEVKEDDQKRLVSEYLDGLRSIN